MHALRDITNSPTPRSKSHALPSNDAKPVSLDFRPSEPPKDCTEKLLKAKELQLQEAQRRAARAECQVEELMALLVLMESEGFQPRPAMVDQGCQAEDGFLSQAPPLPPPLVSPKDTILGLALTMHELRTENNALRAAHASLAIRQEEAQRGEAQRAAPPPAPPLRRYSADMRPLPQALALPSVAASPKPSPQPPSVLQMVRRMVTNSGKTA